MSGRRARNGRFSPVFQAGDELAMDLAQQDALEFFEGSIPELSQSPTVASEQGTPLHTAPPRAPLSGQSIASSTSLPSLPDLEPSLDIGLPSEPQGTPGSIPPNSFEAVALDSSRDRGRAAHAMRARLSASSTNVRSEVPATQYEPVRMIHLNEVSPTQRSPAMTRSLRFLPAGGTGKQAPSAIVHGENKRFQSMSSVESSDVPPNNDVSPLSELVDTSPIKFGTPNRHGSAELVNSRRRSSRNTNSTYASGSGAATRAATASNPVRVVNKHASPESPPHIKFGWRTRQINPVPMKITTNAPPSPDSPGQATSTYTMSPSARYTAESVMNEHVFKPLVGRPTTQNDLHEALIRMNRVSQVFGWDEPGMVYRLSEKDWFVVLSNVLLLTTGHHLPEFQTTVSHLSPTKRMNPQAEVVHVLDHYVKEWFADDLVAMELKNRDNKPFSLYLAEWSGSEVAFVKRAFTRFGERSMIALFASLVRCGILYPLYVAYNLLKHSSTFAMSDDFDIHLFQMLLMTNGWRLTDKRYPEQKGNRPNTDSFGDKSLMYTALVRATHAVMLDHPSRFMSSFVFLMGHVFTYSDNDARGKITIGTIMAICDNYPSKVGMLVSGISSYLLDSVPGRRQVENGNQARFVEVCHWYSQLSRQMRIHTGFLTLLTDEMYKHGYINSDWSLELLKSCSMEFIQSYPFWQVMLMKMVGWHKESKPHVPDNPDKETPALPVPPREVALTRIGLVYDGSSYGYNKGNNARTRKLEIHSPMFRYLFGFGFDRTQIPGVTEAPDPLLITFLKYCSDRHQNNEPVNIKGLNDLLTAIILEHCAAPNVGGFDGDAFYYDRPDKRQFYGGVLTTIYQSECVSLFEHICGNALDVNVQTGKGVNFHILYQKKLFMARDPKTTDTFLIYLLKARKRYMQTAEVSDERKEKKNNQLFRLWLLRAMYMVAHDLRESAVQYFFARRGTDKGKIPDDPYGHPGPYPWEDESRDVDPKLWVDRFPLYTFNDLPGTTARDSQFTKYIHGYDVVRYLVNCDLFSLTGPLAKNERDRITQVGKNDFDAGPISVYPLHSLDWLPLKYVLNSGDLKVIRQFWRQYCYAYNQSANRVPYERPATVLFPNNIESYVSKSRPVGPVVAAPVEWKEQPWYDGYGQ